MWMIKFLSHAGINRMIRLFDVLLHDTSVPTELIETTMYLEDSVFLVRIYNELMNHAMSLAYEQRDQQFLDELSEEYGIWVSEVGLWEEDQCYEDADAESYSETICEDWWSLDEIWDHFGPHSFLWICNRWGWPEDQEELRWEDEQEDEWELPATEPIYLGELRQIAFS